MHATYLFSEEQKKDTQGLVHFLSGDGGRYIASEKHVRSSFSSSVLIGGGAVSHDPASSSTHVLTCWRRGRGCRAASGRSRPPPPRCTRSCRWPGRPAPRPETTAWLTIRLQVFNDGLIWSFTPASASTDNASQGGHVTAAWLIEPLLPAIFSEGTTAPPLDAIVTVKICTFPPSASLHMMFPRQRPGRGAEGSGLQQHASAPMNIPGSNSLTRGTTGEEPHTQIYPD